MATAAISPTGFLARRWAVGGYTGGGYAGGGGGYAKSGRGSREEVWSVMGTTLRSVHESRLRTS
ncbi:hypothetical protein GCM10010393_14120 [Streptomyces gobitricini]|uniref:Uncharacterized protein n=1 Tax=Streptomyces gobitricini TaxID=68211 RepID=A0ABN3LJU0_9ACTN